MYFWPTEYWILNTVWGRGIRGGEKKLASVSRADGLAQLWVHHRDTVSCGLYHIIDNADIWLRAWCVCMCVQFLLPLLQQEQAARREAEIEISRLQVHVSTWCDDLHKLWNSLILLLMCMLAQRALQSCMRWRTWQMRHKAQFAVPLLDYRCWCEVIVMTNF